jgi:hypothetical protein
MTREKIKRGLESGNQLPGDQGSEAVTGGEAAA